jgi:hypothetical protein
MIRFTLALFAATLAFGQEEMRTFHVTNVPNADALRNIGPILRTIAQIQQIIVDEARFDISVTSTPVNVALAGWIVKQLDTATPDPAAGTYQVPGSTEVVRIYYTAHTPNQATLNELVTALRTVGDLREIFTYSALNACVVRTDASQAPLADWLVSQLDRAPDDQTRWQPHQFNVPGAPGQVVRVMYRVGGGPLSNLNEMVTTLRAICDVQKIFTRSVPQGIAFRGTTAQTQMADWLFQQLDVQPDNQMRAQAHEYLVPDAPDSVARVYYLQSHDTQAAMNELATAIRTLTNVRRIFVCMGPKALAVRGNPDTIALADRLIKEKDSPAAP